MDDLDVLARDFGLGARGKANPMKPQSRDTRADDNPLFSDVFGGQPKYMASSNSRSTADRSLGADFNYNSIFKSSAGNDSSNVSSSARSSLPVFDKPVYDEDIFDGVPGLTSRSSTSTLRFGDDMLASDAAPRAAEVRKFSADFDDLLGNFGRNEKGREENASTGAEVNSSSKGFDDLLAGFGSSSSPTSRRIPESRWGSVPTVGSKEKSLLNDPFVVLESGFTHHTSSGVTSDPLEEIGKFRKSVDVKAEVSPVKDGAFEDLDPLSTLGNSSRKYDNGDNGIHSASEIPQSAAAREPLQNEVPMDRYKESPLFQTEDDFSKVVGSASSSPYHETGSNLDTAPISNSGGSSVDDIWLTVSEIPLFTMPSTAPPPSRNPPSIPGRTSMAEPGPFSSSFRRNGAQFSSPSKDTQQSQSPKMHSASESSVFSQFDKLDDFSRGRPESNFDDSDVQMHSVAAASAAAMKDAMDKAEAKFRHAKEVREREFAKASRKKEYDPLEKDEDEQEELTENQDRLEREWKQKEEEERKQWELESERMKKIENEKARLVVERATREARERAASQARLKAERGAVEKANAEARERAERVAVQKVQSEAQERAAVEAKVRAEKAAADARKRMENEEREKAGKVEAEARRRAERAAVERVTAQARERAATEALQRAARMNQQKNDDLESFFSTGRASSTPRERTGPTDPFFEQFQGKEAPEVGKRAPSSGATLSNIRKVSSSNNVIDDLSFIFGATPSSGEFQEVEGESEERRRSRIERHQRTHERAAKALAEKNQRDLQAQKEQEERHRISETLDSEIKRWAAGKEGNLRALLSTLQYVLWPECGWQPVSLTELITGASVKKVYRKATLCIHPDKVQQKGATIQQKYIAEKVFDLLKESWNKFNSEELF